MSSLLAVRTQLKDELRTMEMILFKHNNQHRRTFYFRSFKSAVKVARSLLSDTKKLGGEMTDSDKREALQKAAKKADAALASILLHARRVTMQQKGAGFANFMAVLTAAIANVLLLVKQIKESLQSRAAKLAK